MALEFELDDGTQLRVERDLDAETARVIDIGTGAELTDRFDRDASGALQLGRQLLGVSRDIYTNTACISRSEVMRLEDAGSIKEVIVEMTKKRLGVTAVTGSDGKLAGIITDGDLRRSMQRVKPKDLSFAELKCDELMTRNPVVANPEMLAFDALRLMEDRPSQINVLPVVDGNRRCVGLIRLHDIVRSGL